MIYHKLGVAIRNIKVAPLFKMWKIIFIPHKNNENIIYNLALVDQSIQSILICNSTFGPCIDRM